MILTRTPQGLEFTDGALLAGVYRYNDLVKPHLQALRSPLGTALTTVQSAQYQGVLFTLRTSALDFTELPLRDTVSGIGQVPGRQRQVDAAPLVATGPRVGFVQTLSWESTSGNQVIFLESRELHCERLPYSFCWTWHSKLEAQCSGELLASPGLSFNFTREADLSERVRPNGKDMELNSAQGLTPRELVLKFNYRIPMPARIRYALWQEQDYALSLQHEPSGSRLTLGPNDPHPVPFQKGKILEARFKFELADRKPQA